MVEKPTPSIREPLEGDDMFLEKMNAQINKKPITI